MVAVARVARPEAVRFVVDAFVEASVVIVPDAAVSADTVVVARFEVEVAVKVPVTSAEVVALVAVRLVKNPVIAVRRFVKRLVLVALVIRKLVDDPFEAKNVVAVALVNTDDEPLRLEKVPVVLLRVATVADAAVSDEIVVVAKVEVPVTKSELVA